MGRSAWKAISPSTTRRAKNLDWAGARRFRCAGAGIPGINRSATGAIRRMPSRRNARRAICLRRLKPSEGGSGTRDWEAWPAGKFGGGLFFYRALLSGFGRRAAQNRYSPTGLPVPVAFPIPRAIPERLRENGETRASSYGNGLRRCLRGSIPPRVSFASSARRARTSGSVRLPDKQSLPTRHPSATRPNPESSLPFAQ
jgi:hypothetical protein